MSGRIFLGRYEVIHPLGEGGMGKVFLARDLQLNEPLAIKVMHEHLAANPDYRQRFEGEMQLLRRFSHPHAVQIHDASMEDAQGPCIIMEYLPGISLDRLLKENVRFMPTRVYRFVQQLCEVLQAAHDQGIIHRDLKPSNLMILDADTPQERLKVMDFGIAKVLEPSDGEANHQSEIAVGTPGYMSPEQFRGDPIDHRSDLYSLGAIIYQLLTGRLPFAGASTMEIMIEQATSPPPAFAELGVKEHMATKVEPVVRSALALDPDGRPASAQEFFQAYEGVLTTKEPVPAEAAQTPAVPATATVVHLQTYMAESVAKHKLKAFIHDVGGKITHTSPGFLRVQLKVHPNALKTDQWGVLDWLGLRPGQGLVRLELQMKSTSRTKGTQLEFTVSLRPERDQPLPTNDQWKETCNVIVTSLKQFLMAES